MRPTGRKHGDRKRRKRTLFNGSAKQVLENYFHQQPKPSLKEITLLAKAVRMNEEVVRVWFGNRRFKEKKKRPPSKTAVRQTRSASRAPAPDADASMEHTEDQSSLVAGTSEMIDSNDEVSYDLPRLVSVTSLADNEMDTGSSSDADDMPQIVPRHLSNLIAAQSECASSEAPGLLRNANSGGHLSRRPSTDGQIRIAETMCDSSTHIGNCNGLDLYAVAFQKSDHPFSTIERYVYGQPDGLPEHKTIVIYGADRTNQTKFIDAMLNYIFNVEHKDEFRFQLNQHETNSIQIYTVHHAQGFRIPFTITIVCIPLYDADGDSELFHHQQTAQTFHEYLKNKDGIQGLDMICNIVNEASPNQQSFLSIFGNDVEGIVSSWEPNDCTDGTRVWHLNMQHLFASLTRKKTRSLVLTMHVLEERKQMEAAVKGLQRLVKIGGSKIEEIDKAKQMIVFCQMQIDSNDELDENVESTRKVELPAGQYVNNCDYCHVTCHDSFVESLVLKYEEDGSPSSDLLETTATGFCSSCPEKCNLNMHSNQPYRWVPVKEETAGRPNRVLQDRRRETDIKWNEIKSKGRDLVKQLQKELKENGLAMLEHFQATWRCIQRINKIGLRRNSFLNRLVFDCLFDAEQQLKLLGLDDGLESLRHST
ncbi:hypothetical protein GHT06_013787 [Daphnia sinensis]|uniref:Homeobox domain-containing protein n=1 Tax=Daphnia sinensis TaxID=1820382 RepID=A0AAD5LBS1_9CRUS|nr:hypothetical protein GHT06_013787 [Daphnia sinensis]